MNFKYINNTDCDVSIFTSNKKYKNNYLLSLLPKLVSYLNEFSNITVTDSMGGNKEYNKCIDNVIAYIRTSWEPDLEYRGTVSPDHFVEFQEYEEPPYNYCVSYNWKKSGVGISVDVLPFDPRLMEDFSSVTGINYIIHDRRGESNVARVGQSDEFGYVPISWKLKKKGIIHVRLDTKAFRKYVINHMNSYIENESTVTYWGILVLLIIFIVVILAIVILVSVTFATLRKTYN